MRVVGWSLKEEDVGREGERWGNKEEVGSKVGPRGDRE